VIQVNGWVIGYIEQLYLQRGFEIDALMELAWFPLQLENWKRLLVKTGLNADELMAIDVAFEFSAVTCYKPERLYEEFAAHMSKRPRAVREHQESKASDSLGWRPCGTCGGIGAIIAPIHQTKDGVTRAGTSTFRCDCPNSIRYSSIPMASPDMMQWSREQERLQDRRTANWYADLGGDVTRDSEEHLLSLARKYMQKPGREMFKSVCKAMGEQAKKEVSHVDSLAILDTW
jgi:hypothetical protein